MKILITGINGQVGSQLLKTLEGGDSILGEINTAYKEMEIIGTDKNELDITDTEKVEEYLRKCKPDLVINAAAYTNVDGCEENEELAFKVNSLGVKNLAIACEQIGAKLMHISTDYVFSGENKIPYIESDSPNPISVYGKSKLQGEEYLKSFCSKYFVFRTSWVYGYNGKNFVKTIMKYAKERGILKVVDDQRGNPTNAEELVYHILKVVLTEEYGVYHCTGNGDCTWYEFACEIVKQAGIECKVEAVTSDEFPQKAARPSYSCMDNMRLRDTVGDEMRGWRVALSDFMKNYTD